MAITFTNKSSTSTASTTAVTHATASIAHTAGRRLLIFGNAMRNGHLNGHGSAMVITDNASTNSITWTKLGTESDTLSGATFAHESSVWRSSELTDDETFVITLDADNASSSDQYFYAMRVIDCQQWDGTLADSASNNGATASVTATLGTAPSSGDNQITGLLMQNGSAITTFDTPPTGFTALAGTTISTTGGGRCMVSTTNTATGIADGVDSGAASFFSTHMWALVLNEEITGSGIIVPKLSTAHKHMLTR